MIQGHGRMSPAYKAARVYEQEPCARTFKEDLELHLLNGVVISTPYIFILARPVNKDAEEFKIVNPSYPFDDREWNCWHIYLMAGDLTKLWDYYPIKLEFASWERNNKLKVFNMERVRGKML